MTETPQTTNNLLLLKLTPNIVITHLQLENQLNWLSNLMDILKKQLMRFFVDKGLMRGWYLIQYMMNNQYFVGNDLADVFEQAKAMEYEQLKEMYLKGIENYDPTFKRKEQ